MKNYKFSLLCLGLVILLIINFISSFIRIEQTGIFYEEEKLKIVIDAGHGGEDGGVSEGDVIEKNINLSIARYLYDTLTNNGYDVIMTRDTDEDLADKYLNSVSERKKSDLYARVDIINKSEAVLVVSIHQNHFDEEKYKGAQVFYYSENSKSLAEILQTHLVKELAPDNNRVAKEIKNKFLLEESLIPAVIVECGFLSNNEELNLLLSEEYQLQVAEAIFIGIKDYIKIENLEDETIT